MSFRDIKGHSGTIAFLRGVLDDNRYSHAYIFLGPSGIGKKLAALNFAKALNCETQDVDRPCDKCISCKKIDASKHPDVLLLKPNKEDGASIKIDAIRELIRSIGLKPYEAKKKIYIIDEAESMTQEASNALLKTLEEPASESVLILIAANLGSLLPTIVSRSQVVRFFPLRLEDVKNILINLYKINEAKTHILSNFSAGRVGEAIKYNNEDFFEKRYSVINGLKAKTFFDSDLDEVSKEDLKLYLDIMLTWYRDILVAKAGFAGPSAFINVDRRDEILEEARRLEFSKLEAIIKEIVLTNSFLHENANPKLAMSVLGMSICTK